MMGCMRRLRAAPSLTPQAHKPFIRCFIGIGTLRKSKRCTDIHTHGKRMTYEKFVMDEPII
ncbi:hypothetical protein DICVIV_04784 [Dictyocaulus viviparus]|uniref:Uncharacterized protein n=1 Tax=Dictyocaulus viviparus TaxID=29172 RepID=A0A0D8XYZ0_DICVI|nr:hypothetical protein DICVIV_04784 [Dictyocaulus viviparus]